jgi:hypothetical protein
MDGKWWDLPSRFLPNPYAQIVSLAAVVFSLILVCLLRREQIRALVSSKWSLGLLASPILLGLVACVVVFLITSRPSPKVSGHLRVVVAAQSADPTGNAISLSVADGIQRFVYALHAAAKVEVRLLDPLPTLGSIHRRIRHESADAAVWLRVATPGGGEGVAYPLLLMTTTRTGKTVQIQLTRRSWSSAGHGSLDYAADQLSLEALEALQPLMPSDDNALSTRVYRLTGEELAAPTVSPECVVTREMSFTWRPPRWLREKAGLRRKRLGLVPIGPKVTSPEGAVEQQFRIATSTDRATDAFAIDPMCRTSALLT